MSLETISDFSITFLLEISLLLVQFFFFFFKYHVSTQYINGKIQSFLVALTIIEFERNGRHDEQLAVAKLARTN